MTELTIRKYRDGDERKINDLFNEIFNENRSLEEWFWKFKKNPLGDINLITIAESQGKIVGQYANLPLLFKYRNTVLRVGFPVDNLVHPDFRGGMRGVQKEIFEYQHEVARKNDIFFGLGFPNREAYIIGKRILKYKDIGQIRVLFRRLNWNLAVKRRFPRLPKFILRLFQLIDRIGFRLAIYIKQRDTVEGFKIREIDSFDERFDSFWDKVKEQYEIIEVRDQRYLNWRYKKPGYNYQIIVAEKGDEVVGYIVISVKKTDGGTVGYIVDFLTVQDYRVESALIRKALFACIAKKADFVLSWMLPHTEAYAALHRFGFIEREDFPPVNIVYYVFNNEVIDEAFLKKPKNWYLTMVDSDVF